MVAYDPIGHRQGGYNFVSNALDDVNRIRAGRQYADGDVMGASQTLARGGMIDDSMALNRQQQAISERDRQRALEEQAEDNQWLVRAATGLRGVPYDQRRAVYTSQVRPLLAQNGFDDEELARIDAADYTDSELDALLGALGSPTPAPYANDRAGANGSVLRPDRYTGEYRPVYTPEFDPRHGAPAGYMWTDDTRTRMTYVPGGSADPAVAGALATSRRAPPRARSSGGGSSGASRPAAASAPSSRPWERNW